MKTEEIKRRPTSTTRQRTKDYMTNIAQEPSAKKPNKPNYMQVTMSRVTKTLRPNTAFKPTNVATRKTENWPGWKDSEALKIDGAEVYE